MIHRCCWIVGQICWTHFGTWRNCSKNLPIKSICDISWGCPLYNATMSRSRFLEIMKCLRFDLKTERKRNLEEDKFCLASLLWNQLYKELPEDQQSHLGYIHRLATAFLQGQV